MFEEQAFFAAQAHVDYVIAETYDWVDEALIALKAINNFELNSCITFAIHKDGLTRCGRTPTEACQILRDAGADVVGYLFLSVLSSFLHFRCFG